MPRGKSAVSLHSEGSELEIDGIAESEVAKLQRQFRIMEGDRQAYSVQTQDVVRRQQQEISRLQDEQDELRRNLKVSECLTQRQRDLDSTQGLHSLLQYRDEVEEQLASEKQNISQLEQEIVVMERKLATMRRSAVVPSIHKQKPHSTQDMKTKHAIENKLDRAVTRFNEQLAKNSQLKEELQTLRLERHRFLQLHRRLEKELLDIHKDIGNIIQHAAVAYDARADAQSKVRLMKEKVVKDLAQHSAEVKELERVIVNDQQLRDFMNTKSNERSQQEDGQDALRREEARQQKRADSANKDTDALEKMFFKIQSVTGEQDLDTMVSKFIEVEERNFALFNYVNEQNNEAQTLRDHINQVQEDMQRFQADIMNQKDKRHNLLQDMNMQLQRLQTQIQAHKAQAAADGEILARINSGVEQMFNSLHCDHSMIEDMLGSSGVRGSNIMAYLGLLEHKGNDLLTIQAFITCKDHEHDYDPKDVAQLVMGQSPDLVKEDISIKPPLTGDDYYTEISLLTTEDERPLTHQELRQRVMKAILSREGSFQLGGDKRDSKSGQFSRSTGSRRRPQGSYTSIPSPSR